MSIVKKHRLRNWPHDQEDMLGLNSPAKKKQRAPWRKQREHDPVVFRGLHFCTNRSGRFLASLAQAVTRVTRTVGSSIGPKLQYGNPSLMHVFPQNFHEPTHEEIHQWLATKGGKLLTLISYSFWSFPPHQNSITPPNKDSPSIGWG